MATQVHTIFFAENLKPGVTFHFLWKNLPPGKAYAVEALPFQDLNKPSIPTLEMTSRFHRFRAFEKFGGLGLHIARDIGGQVKNIGVGKLDFVMKLIVF